MTPDRKSAFCALVSGSVDREVLRLLVFSKPIAQDLPKKITARLTVRRGRKILFFEESYPGGRVRQFALSPEEIATDLPPILSNYLQIDLLTSAGDAVLLRSKKGTETLRGGDALSSRLSEDTPMLSALTALDREPERILTGREPFLVSLGVSDANGRVHDKKQPKFRQINRFLEHVADIYAALPDSGTLAVYDLCCGKSYLSFALYHYLTAVRGRDVSMLCMDLKADVMEFCRGIADSAGFLSSDGTPGSLGMRFLPGDIRTLPRDGSPDLVVSLHACDIATDIVLDTAADLRAKVILSTPCCHRYLDKKIVAPELSFVTRHPKLRGKIAEALTDGLRILRLSSRGYEVTAAELVDPDDTPKNTILRAIRTDRPEKTEAAKAEYEAAKRFLLGDGADAYLTDIAGGK